MHRIITRRAGARRAAAQYAAAWHAAAQRAGDGSVRVPAGCHRIGYSSVISALNSCSSIAAQEMPSRSTRLIA